MNIAKDIQDSYFQTVKHMQDSAEQRNSSRNIVTKLIGKFDGIVVLL